MNHEQYLKSMLEIGYSQEDAEGLIWLSRDSSDMVLRTYNFVPTTDGLYEVWFSNERDGFFRVGGVADSGPAVTLDDAYQYVFERKRSWREKQVRLRPNSA
ncbi:hypothetical protein J2Y69_000080 [Microbacterium resistens]|uniref:Immunity protein 35 domain-containing protein n=1 Tax=Microbacterium resistens TaxID=156977 RepID=A0ABU1S7A9_9MICO|nr:hypothetical protein [Microbacterium resistens]